MKSIKTDLLFDLNYSIAAELFKDVVYPFEALPHIGEFILKLGQSLSEDEFEKIDEFIDLVQSTFDIESAFEYNYTRCENLGFLLSYVFKIKKNDSTGWVIIDNQ